MSAIERTPVMPRQFSEVELFDLRRSTLRFARSFPPGPQRNQHRQIALSLRALFRNKTWLSVHSHPSNAEVQP
ncbi:MAG: hypothetical protein JWR89_4089 [Tardiphaga sp.]|jgi:hypothetical protein|uniref:hypothetical protein n=1 Tax=Tardiphaga sp. TaxID=1926292 RepID=UPI002618FBD7|nr:hypothetical protein [Tardiphaga sp.]MDB5504187.1 hypothetical protein [Tardiphaga sp.]